MKILLTALNAKFIHSSLALYYLKGTCTGLTREVSLKEFSINGRFWDIFREIYQIKADLVCFSCYIWNIDLTLKLCRLIKKVLPDTLIVLGGPEVSYQTQEIMETNPAVDYLVVGEGEETFREFVECLLCGLSLEKVKGLVWRQKGKIRENPKRALIRDLDQIPFPYDAADLEKLQNKIVYYESSRGCPFSCQYCLSSIEKGVRFFSLSRVKKDLARLIKAGVNQVKFVDRTFNCQKERAKEIIDFLIKLNPPGINFHFEVVADLLDEQLISLLRQAPPGLIQMEIGIQSTNQRTLEIVGRQMNFTRVQETVTKLREGGNIHLHLDLIAGLPGEGLLSFTRSFDDVFLLFPNQLQLGFLKLLKGSGMRDRAEEFGIKYQDFPPYEVLETNVLSFDDLLKLKTVEELLESYFNSQRFRQTLTFAAARFPSGPFAFFLRFAGYLFEKTAGLASTREDQARNLLDFVNDIFSSETAAFCVDLIKLDWLLIGKKQKLPAWMVDYASGKKDLTMEFTRNQENVTKFLPHLAGMNPKKLYKMITVEKFNHFFIYDKGRVLFSSASSSLVIFDYTLIDSVFGYPRVSVIDHKF